MPQQQPPPKPPPIDLVPNRPTKTKRLSGGPMDGQEIKVDSDVEFVYCHIPPKGVALTREECVASIGIYSGVTDWYGSDAWSFYPSIEEYSAAKQRELDRRAEQQD